MKTLTKKQTVLYLIIWFILVAAIYYLPVYLQNPAFSFAVMLLYAVLGILLFIVFLLVNGGVRPIIDKEHEKQLHNREEPDSPDCNKKAKKRSRYGNHNQSENDTLPAEKPQEPRFNPFHLDYGERVYYSKILLILLTPFILIFFIDYLYLFLADYFLSK